jgi:DNA-binding transcriptional regulator YiaG
LGGVGRHVADVLHEVASAIPGDPVCARTLERTLRDDQSEAAFERALVAELARGEVGPQGFSFLRRAAGLQASRLAALLDVTPGTVSRWENGRKPRERRAVALAAALALEAQGDRAATRDLLERLAARRKQPKRVLLGVASHIERP